MPRPDWRVATMLFAVALTACGSDRQAASDTTAAPPASAVVNEAAADTAATVTTATAESTSTTREPAAAKFGDLPWPCGPGEAPNIDDGTTTGVTADSVRIATGDDAGFATSPGMNHEITDAVNALAKKCNELGGINGRIIEVGYFDAAIVNVSTAIQSACDADTFYLVGEGWSLDAGQEEIRHACGLPAVPTYTVSAAFAMAPDVHTPAPNPADEVNASGYALFAELRPDAVELAATLAGNYSATQETVDKVRAVTPQFGWNFVPEKLEYDIFGVVTDWTPFVKQIRDSGATMIYYSGSCLPTLQQFARTAIQNGLDIPILTEANHYSTECAAANTDGALDNVYMPLPFVPFEEASKSKATQDYIDLVTDNGGDVALLGAQGASAFLLWATAADACGTELTRQCVHNNLDNTHDWTSGGLHTSGDPGANHPPSCGTLLKLNGTRYERVLPTEPGTFSCDPDWVGTVTAVPALEPLNLDANRHSHQFDN